MNVSDIDNKILAKQMSTKEVDNMLLEINWIEHPDLIRRLLDYKNSPNDNNIPIVEKTDAELKKEWKTEMLPDNTIRLTSYNGSDSIIVVPEKIGKIIVSEIGDYAFAISKPRLKKEIKESRARIKEVRMSSTVKKLGSFIFEGCESLETVMLSSLIKEIPDCAFMGCKKLKKVDLHKGIEKIGGKAFKDCISLEEMIIPEGVTCFSILDSVNYKWFYTDIGTFDGCKNLKKVTLPESMTIIPGWTFSDCEKLSEINIPLHLEKIDTGAFKDCKNLTMLILPKTITSIEVDKEYIAEASFKGCKKLKLQVESGSYAEEYAIENGIPYNND